MKVNMVIYGCVSDQHRYRVNIAEKDFRLTFSFAIQKVWDSFSLEGLTISVDTRDTVVPRLFVADLTISKSEGENDLNFLDLDKLTVEFGELWKEFVRSFLDSGALICTRVTMGNYMAKWSPHHPQ